MKKFFVKVSSRHKMNNSSNSNSSSKEPATQEAGELAELQKEIINATWKVVRRETRTETTPEFPSDTKLIEDSQQSAIERLKELTKRLEDSESLAHVQIAQSHMDEARKQLKSAAEGTDAAPLRPALSAEQAAYQALLKLRAREFQVVRGAQQRGGANAGQGGNSRSQRQLDQLELRADENRYETQSRASNPEENAAQRESREVLNRLRDLRAAKKTSTSGFASCNRRWSRPGHHRSATSLRAN